MIHNRNAQAALLATVTGVVVIVGWFFVASQLFGGGPTNIAFEILKNGRDDQVREITVGRIPIPLMPDVSMLITRTRWTQSRLSSTAATIPPGSPELRFLFVDYEIVNDSSDTVLLDGLVNLFKVVHGTAVVANGNDDEAGRGSTVRQYGVEIDVQSPLEVPPAETFDGSWFFELDSRQSNLRLRSALVEITIRLPVDEGHPLQLQ